MNRYILFIFFSFLIVVGFFLYQRATLFDSKLHIVFCDVGQGDAIYIRTPDSKNILIDGGPDESVLDCLSSNMPFWEHRIDMVFLTHPHSDHVTGLLSVLERYDVSYFGYNGVSYSTSVYNGLLKVLEDKNIVVKKLSLGSKVGVSGVEFLALWPSGKHLSSFNSLLSDPNQTSIVLKLSYEEFDALFTGDAEILVWDQIKSSLSDVEILKVPHQGAKLGMNTSFLTKTLPEVAVITVGENNSYGHPKRESLELLSKFNVKTFRTDKDGEIEIVSDGVNFWIK